MKDGKTTTHDKSLVALAGKLVAYYYFLFVDNQSELSILYGIKAQ
jgi:hypothetical protein